MHSKVKNLESRYLDLANFYKRELLAGGASMNNSRFSALASASLQPGATAFLKTAGGSDDFTPYLNQDLRSSLKRDISSPIGGARMDSVTQPFDECIEKNLISDLLREKNELEKEL